MAGLGVPNVTHDYDTLNRRGDVYRCPRPRCLNVYFTIHCHGWVKLKGLSYGKCADSNSYRRTAYVQGTCLLLVSIFFFGKARNFQTFANYKELVFYCTYVVTNGVSKSSFLDHSSCVSFTRAGVHKCFVFPNFTIRGGKMF
jgi:hypothetical protein